MESGFYGFREKTIIQQIHHNSQSLYNQLPLFFQWFISKFHIHRVTLFYFFIYIIKNEVI